MEKTSLIWCFAILFLCLISHVSGGPPPPAAPAGPDLMSKKFEETGCPKLKPAKNLKPEWITKTAAWYLPMGSAYTYHTWVEKLTNKSAGKDDIANLCLKLLFLASDKPNSPYMVVAGGLKKAVIYRCMAKGPHQQVCEGIRGSPGYQPTDSTDETLIATDNQNWALMGRCINKNIKLWYVMTPSQNPLTAEAKQEIVKVVQQYGFNAKYGSMISYEKCPKPAPQKPGQGQKKGK